MTERGIRRLLRPAIRGAVALALLAAAALGSAARVEAAEGATVAFAPTNVEVGQGATSAVAVRVDGVTGLYGVDLKLRFDPAAVEVADADPTRDGVQLQLGDFLEPGLVVTYEADNQAGTARLVLTQVNPAAPKDGGGVLCTLILRGKAAGSDATLQVEAAELSTQTGEAITVTTGNGEVHVVAAAQAPATPTTAPTVQPVLDLPTEAPGEPTPTVPVESATQASDPTVAPTATATTAAAGTGGATPTATAPAATAAPSVEPATAPAVAVAETATPVTISAQEAATAVPSVAAMATAQAPEPAATAAAAPVATVASAPVAAASAMVAASPTPQALALAADATAPSAPTEAALVAVQSGSATSSLWLLLAAIGGLIVATGGLLVVAQSRRHRH